MDIANPPTKTPLVKNYASENEVLEAKQLAINTLRDHGRLLGQNQAQVLNNFLSKSRGGKGRKTVYQCMKIFNIVVAVQQKLLKMKTVK